MTKRYLIEDLKNGGYWSSSHSDFKGILFANYYHSTELAEMEIDHIGKKYTNCVFRIVPVYVK